MIVGAGTGGSAVAGFIVLAALYFIPTIVAMSRKVTNSGSVFVINLLLGWTVIGWIIALAMAVKTKTPQVVVVTQATPLPACASCGTSLIPGQQFCSNCGTSRAPIS